MHGEIFVLISITGAIAFVLYLLISSRHKERMALLESGKDASVFTNNGRLKDFRALKFGIFLLFAGAGILLGYMMHKIMNFPEGIAIFSFLFISAGAGLLAYYFLASKIEEREH